MPLPHIHRLFQFSLRTMLIVVVVFSVWLGMTVRKARQQKAAVAWVKDMGGRALYDYEGDFWFPGDEPPGPDWLRELIGVDYFATVVAAWHFSPEVSDLSPLAKLLNLKQLCLYETNVNDVSVLAKLTKLETLALCGIPVSDLSPLAKLTKLEHLVLSCHNASDLSPLASLTNLKQLDMDGTLITAEEVAKLQSALPNCKINYDPTG